MPKDSEKIIEKDVIPLTDNEAHLIHLLRTKYRFGKVTIVTHDGRPTFIEKTVERQQIGSSG